MQRPRISNQELILKKAEIAQAEQEIETVEAKLIGLKMELEFIERRRIKGR